MNKKGQRLHQALSKFFFCIQHAATPLSLLRLLYNTKKLSAFIRKRSSATVADKPVPYQLQFKGKKITLRFRTYSGDLQIFYEIFWRQVYAVAGVDIASCKTIIDLGGNIGISAVYFSLQATKASVWVVEPDAGNFFLLRQNTAMLHNKVTLVHAAIASRSGTVFIQQNHYAYNSRVSTVNAGTPVGAISMNDFISQHRIGTIDLIKIDIEGSEEDLFSQGIEWLGITKQLIVEIHSAPAFSACKKALDAYGLKLSCLSGSFGKTGIYYALRHF